MPPGGQSAELSFIRSVSRKVNRAELPHRELAIATAMTLAMMLTLSFIVIPLVVMVTSISILILSPPPHLFFMVIRFISSASVTSFHRNRAILRLGFMTNEGAVTFSFLVAIFIANFPEAFSGASLLLGQRMSVWRIPSPGFLQRSASSPSKPNAVAMFQVDMFRLVSRLLVAHCCAIHVGSLRRLPPPHPYRLVLQVVSLDVEVEPVCLCLSLLSGLVTGGGVPLVLLFVPHLAPVCLVSPRQEQNNCECMVR